MEPTKTLHLSLLTRQAASEELTRTFPTKHPTPFFAEFGVIQIITSVLSFLNIQIQDHVFFSKIKLTILGLVILVEIILTWIGAFSYPVYRLYDGIRVDLDGVHYHSQDVRSYTLWSTVKDVRARGQSLFLALLLFLFVILLPMLKWITVLAWLLFHSLSQRVFIPVTTAISVPNSEHLNDSKFLSSSWMMTYIYAILHVYHPWDMRDVFFVTLIILWLRVQTTIDGLSHGYASMKLGLFGTWDGTTNLGLYFQLTAVILDHGLFIACNYL